MQAVSDADLLVRVGQGDREALGELYDRYAGHVLTICCARLADSAEAEDVAHEVFLEVWKRAPLYDPLRGSVRTFLAVLARSRSLDRVRRRQRNPATAVTVETLQQLPQESVDGGSQRDHENLMVLVHALPQILRDVVLMTYQEDLTATEIATRLQIPVGTVKSRLRLARTALRNTLLPDSTL